MHRGCRGEASRARYSQRRLAARFVLDHSYVDRQRGESVCLSSREAVLDVLCDNFDSVLVDAANFVRGEVLVDKRGSGSLQRP